MSTSPTLSHANGHKSPTSTPKPRPMIQNSVGYSSRSRRPIPHSAPPKPYKDAAKEAMNKFKAFLKNSYGYSEQHPLGHGDSGVVYKVRDATGELALKVPQRPASSATLKEEYDKARLLPSHDHLIDYVELIDWHDDKPSSSVSMDFDFPHSAPGCIPQSYSSASIHTHYAVLLELAAGGTLYDRVKKGPLSESEMKPFVRDILDGLAHIHSHGFMHLDIKPENIFLSGENGPCLIGDFGRLLAHSQYTPHCSPEGDARYMALELLGDTVPPVHGPDIFSLAILILECATTLEIPMSGEGKESWQMLRSEVYPSAFIEHLSPEFQDIIKKMLSKDPYRRPTAAELLADPYFADVHPLSSGRKKMRSSSSPTTPLHPMPSSYLIASSAPSHRSMINSSAWHSGVPSYQYSNRMDEDIPTSPSVCRTLRF